MATAGPERVLAALVELRRELEERAAALPKRPPERRRLLRHRRALARWILGGRP